MLGVVFERVSFAGRVSAAAIALSIKISVVKLKFCLSLIRRRWKFGVALDQ